MVDALVLTVFEVLFGGFPPSSPVDARGLGFAAPRTQRVLFEPVGVLERVLVVLVPHDQQVVVDDRLPGIVMDVSGTSGRQCRVRQL